MGRVRGKNYSGKILNVNGAADQGFWFGGRQGKFSVTVQLDRPDPELRPGFTTKITLIGDRLSKAMSVPREAVFDRNQKSVVYLRSGGAWLRQEVKIKAVSEGRAVVEGVAAGATVALADPEKNATEKEKTARAAVGPGGP